MRASAKSDYDPIAAGARCNECPLRGSVVVPPTIVEDADMFIFGENPGANEVREGRGFVGAAGTLLNQILSEVGIDRKRCSISNTILCRCTVPGEKSHKKKYDTKEFMSWLKNENARARKAAKAAKLPFKPVPTPMECCWPRLKRELEHAETSARRRGMPNGAVIVPVGNYAVAAVLRKQGIMKLRGSVTVLEKIE